MMADKKIVYLFLIVLYGHEEAKLMYQRVFEIHDVKDKISDIEKEADLQDVPIQSLIDYPIFD